MSSSFFIVMLSFSYTFTVKNDFSHFLLRSKNQYKYHIKWLFWCIFANHSKTHAARTNQSAEKKETFATLWHVRIMYDLKFNLIEHWYLNERMVSEINEKENGSKGDLNELNKGSQQALDRNAVLCITKQRKIIWICTWLNLLITDRSVWCESEHSHSLVSQLKGSALAMLAHPAGYRSTGSASQSESLWHWWRWFVCACWVHLNMFIHLHLQTDSELRGNCVLRNVSVEGNPRDRTERKQQNSF